MIEATIEAYLDTRIKALGGETRKVKWPGRRGAPDRMVLLPPRAYGWPRFFLARHPLVELKRPKGGVLEPHQVREHERLRAAGFEVLVLWSIEDIDREFPLS